ncbi:hypothetical protein ACF0H5_023104 [Mactra antiquata]
MRVFIAVVLLLALADASILQRLKKDAGCPCILVIDPVCGKNSKTYDNLCKLQCDAIELDHHGACNSRRKRSFFEYEDCNCPKIYLPVCGVNDVTYHSQCVRRCAGVAFKSFGDCKDSDK